MTSFLISGLLAGAVGLMIHHLWIRPIWFILPAGLFMAGLGGLVVGWSYYELLPHLPPRPWTVFALVAVIGATLAPSVLLGQLRPPLIDTATVSIRPGEGMVVAMHFALELVLTATVVGGLAAWIITRSLSAAIATAAAGLVFAIGPGHNIPLLANTPAVTKGLLLLFAIVVLSAMVLVEGNAWPARR